MPGYPVPHRGFRLLLLFRGHLLETPTCSDHGFSEICSFRGYLTGTPVRFDHGFSEICYFRGYLLEPRYALIADFQKLVISGVIPSG